MITVQQPSRQPPSTGVLERVDKTSDRWNDAWGGPFGLVLQGFVGEEVGGGGVSSLGRLQVNSTVRDLPVFTYQNGHCMQEGLTQTY